MKVTRGSVQGYKEMQIPFNILSKEEESRKLAIFFPGAGYTVQAPFLHYSIGVFINKSYDVLEVNYHYEDAAYDAFSMEELGEAVKRDAKAVIDHLLSHHSYDSFCLVGKSLGTIAMASELQRDAFKKAGAVWLTPLLQRDEVYEAMANGKNKSLGILGDKDGCYIEKRFEQLKENHNLKLMLLPGINHSLEYSDDAVGSIDVLKQVMETVKAF
jgi:hypothetical protein